MATATIPEMTLIQTYEQEFPTSRKLAKQARELFPGGVTHDLRYLEPFPVYVERAQGPYKWDVDGRQLIDYFSGHGALLLGHSHPDIVTAVQNQIEHGTHPGACHELEIEWGQRVKRLVPSAEKIRFVNSGTEATLMALRLARIATGKPKALKFAGHFHGWNDYVTLSAGTVHDNAAVPGVPEGVSENIVVVPPNDPDAVDKALGNDDQIGCVILEPTGGHMGVVPIRGQFLQALRELTEKYQRLLIFDEVVTGFRVHPGGAQAHYGVTPDLTTLAKVLAGGLPGGCLAGRDDILSYLIPRPGKPKMNHPGTFNANPLSAAAGVAALKIVSTGEPCSHANDMARLLRQKLNALFQQVGIDWVAYGEFSCFKVLTGYDGPVPDGADFIPYNGDSGKIDQPRDTKLVHAFRLAMLLNGVDLPGFAGITTATHTQVEIAQTVAAFGAAVELLQRNGLV